MRLNLSYSDTLKYEVYGALILEPMRTFLANMKYIVKLWATRDLRRVRTNEKPLVRIHIMLLKTTRIIFKKI